MNELIEGIKEILESGRVLSPQQKCHEIAGLVARAAAGVQAATADETPDEKPQKRQKRGGFDREGPAAQTEIPKE